MSRLSEIAQNTPSHRERVVDLLRAVSIVVVVLGHWMMIVVIRDKNGLDGFSALDDLAWAHPLTWLFQVMPLFFFVGGFANAASLTAHRDRGGRASDWLAARSARLIRPTAVLILVVSVAGVIARLSGADLDQIRTAAWLASMPLWFLVAYLGAVFLTPPMHALHRRWGFAVPLVLVALVAVGDFARFRNGPSAGNYLFAWLAIHQLGFAWRDGRLPARPAVSVPLAVGGLVTLVALTLFGPYPISMINAGGGVQNTAPPTLALLALATMQIGLVLLLRDPLERWLRRRRPWTAVVAVNSVIMTVFLWHMSAVVLVSIVLYLSGWLPNSEVGSAAWFLWKVPWVAVLGLVLTGLVVLFGRFERAGRSSVVAASAPTVIIGYAGVVLGLLFIAVAPRSDDGLFGLPTLGTALFLFGAGVLWADSAWSMKRNLPAYGRSP